ncbi:MAG: hypothetical protein WC718_04330 [Phycisphaerales bacterium]|jgi:hypothetical protein
MWINDFDCTRLGFALDNDLEGHRAGLTFQDRTTALPGRVGTIALGRERETTARTITTGGVQIATSVNQLVADADDLKRRATMGTVELRFSDEPTRFYLARLQTFEVTVMPPALRPTGTAMHRVRMVWLCSDPLSYEVSGTVVAFSTIRAECPVGSAPSLPQIRIFGPSTGVAGYTLTYRDAGGNTVATFALAGAAATLTSTQTATIDMELATVLKSNGANMISGLSTAATFFALDPQDASGSTGPYPTMAINRAGQGGDLLYRRAWI